LLEHIDLVIVRRGERVVVSVPVHTEGKYDQDGILEHTNNSIEVEVDVTNIPAFLMLNMEGMMAGESKTASEVILPEGVKLVSDPKMTVVHLSVRSAEVEEVAVVAAPAEGEAAATAAAPAEGEAAAEGDDKKDKKSK
jgi:large subunit ribosomal protein L25